MASRKNGRGLRQRCIWNDGRSGTIYGNDRSSAIVQPALNLTIDSDQRGIVIGQFGNSLLAVDVICV